MTYSAGGLIQATDYNGFVGPTASGGTAGANLNDIWSTGSGDKGWGQTVVPTVSTGGTVTATQWTTLVNGVNTVRKHQTGAGFTNIGTYTVGQTITAAADVSGNLTTAFTNRLTASAQGATVAGTTNSPNFTGTNSTSAYNFYVTRTATFANADAARYFFNAGGQLNFIITSTTNGDATNRSSSLVNLCNNFASKKIGAQDAVAKTGSGNATVTTDLTTNNGYYTYTTSNVTLTQLTSTQTTYTGDILYFYAKTNGVQGSNSDNGTVVSLGLQLTSGTQTGGFNDSINITMNHNLTVIYPESTFLANTWGAVTVA